jgi:hypothetical protein
MTEVSNFHSNMRPSLAALAILAIVSQLAPSACVAHGFIRSSNQATYVGISTASRHQSEHEIESLTGIGVQISVEGVADGETSHQELDSKSVASTEVQMDHHLGNERIISARTINRFGAAPM